MLLVPRLVRSDMDSTQLSWITNFIWGIADDVLRDLFKRGMDELLKGGAK